MLGVAVHWRGEFYRFYRATRYFASRSRISTEYARRDAGCDVYAYFNNDVGGHAPRDAVTLRRVLEETA